MEKIDYNGMEIAVVGMSCRFPGAESCEQFWDNIRMGVDSIERLSDIDLAMAGVSDETASKDNYVRAASRIEDIEAFDAEFFGIPAREAKLMDPQQRLFLECAWESLEAAGYARTKSSISVGVFAGAGPNTYFPEKVIAEQNIPENGYLDTMPGFQAMLGNDKDYMATRVSYRLGLRGPSVNVQSACSTSSVAIHQAYQSLLTGECSLAIAGGSTVLVPDGAGYMYQDAMILSPDGICRPFDADAKGTVFGSGVGVIALRRLQDAINDGDQIHAVIKGSAINNDGADKVSFSAPSVDGQSDVIALAMGISGIPPSSISYIEAHGTGTSLGDPIEVEALRQAFSSDPDLRHTCALGSVKANIGHLIAAAGVAGVIKTIMALKHRIIPPSLHYSKPNPEIDFDNSPFYVNTKQREWVTDGHPRRAGVSSFGVGGSNSHIILEEYQRDIVEIEAAPPSIVHPLTLSARTHQAARALARRYENYLTCNKDESLADICYTANTTRMLFEHRISVVGRSRQQLAERLADVVDTNIAEKGFNEPKLAFIFTGQGSQFSGMGRTLFDHNQVFRSALLRCDEILQPILGQSLLGILYSDDITQSEQLNKTEFTQPALFALEYALFKLWRSYGLTPSVVMGHSVGEYVAACIAGIFSLEDGLTLIAKRGNLMQSLPNNGGMLAVKASLAEVEHAIQTKRGTVSVGAANGSFNTVISGLKSDLDKLESDFHNQNRQTTKLVVSHAFHSPLMEPILDEFYNIAKGISYAEPQIPLISNVTGEIADEIISTPDYWVDHITNPVLFDAGVKCAYDQGISTFLEIGPQPILCSMGPLCIPEPSQQPAWIPSMRQNIGETEQVAEALGQLHCNGFTPDWRKVHGIEEARCVELPTYPFEKQRYWIESGETNKPEWHCRNTWQVLMNQPEVEDAHNSFGMWLIVSDCVDTAALIANELSTLSQLSVCIRTGTKLKQVGVLEWSLDIRSASQFESLLSALNEQYDAPISGVIYANTSFDGLGTSSIAGSSANSSQYIMEFVDLARSMAACDVSIGCKLWLHTTGAVRISSHDKSAPFVYTYGAQLRGVGRVLANEHPDVWGGYIDWDPDQSEQSAKQAVALMLTAKDEMEFALRDGNVLGARLVVDSQVSAASVKICPNSTYLITGGLGALGRNITQWLLQKGARHIALVGRSMQSESKVTALSELQEQCSDVKFFAAQVNDESNLKTVFDAIGTSEYPLRGVIHTAGIIEDAMLCNLTLESVERVLQPKLDGTMNLDKLSRGADLDFFACFSSISAVLGMKGQASYVAANCAMDSIVEGRNRDGLPAVSINWGPWSEVGMAAELDDKFRKRLKSFGIFGIETDVGLQKLDKLLTNKGVVSAAPILWSVYCEKQYGRVPPFVDALVCSKSNVSNDKQAKEMLLLKNQIEQYSVDEQHSYIVDQVVKQVASVLGVEDASKLSHSQPLNRLGFDSLMTIEFRNTISRLGVSVSLEQMIVGINIDQLSRELHAQVSEQLAQASATSSIAPIKVKSISTDTSCIIVPKPNPEATIRLIGFPYAGGGPLVFQSWLNKLPDYVELGILQLPGRSARLKENFYTHMDEMVDALTPAMIPFLDRPFAFFGHCVGGVQCFEVSQRLRRDFDLHPEHLFVAGGRSPHIYNKDQFAIDVQQFNHETGVAEHELAEEDFIEMLREVNFANNKALFEDKEMRDIMLPIINADYEINNTYNFGDHPPLDVPITAIGGRIDPYVTGEHIYGWAKHTTREFKVQFCAGDHYFMEAQGDLLTGIVARDLAHFDPLNQEKRSRIA